jgi:hypothetical protein
MRALEDIRARIDAACKAMEARGIRIGCDGLDGWGVAWGESGPYAISDCLCPLAALVVAEALTYEGTFEYCGDATQAAASRGLGVDVEWSIYFSEGFDGTDSVPPALYLQAFNLGAGFRNAYVGDGGRA